MSPSVSTLAHVAELWRFPVKSMHGEQVGALEVLRDGMAHDRRYALVSSGAPAGKPRLASRERAALLRYFASVSANGTEVLTPEGRRFGIHDPALLPWLEQHLPHGNRITLEHDPSAAPYTDVRPVALVSTQTLAALSRGMGQAVDARRFRANLLLTFASEIASELTRATPGGFPEDALAGQTVQIGATCRLRLLERIPRCRVVTLDPDTAEPDPALMKYLDRHHGGRLGMYAAVLTPGPLRVGAAVSLPTETTVSAEADATR